MGNSSDLFSLSFLTSNMHGPTHRLPVLTVLTVTVPPEHLQCLCVVNVCSRQTDASVVLSSFFLVIAAEVMLLFLNRLSL